MADNSDQSLGIASNVQISRKGQCFLLARL
jgi:hypothetical protein